jgi:hypothetical protein
LTDDANLACQFPELKRSLMENIKTTNIKKMTLKDIRNKASKAFGFLYSIYRIVGQAKD